jgi:hypothetical protein
VTPWGPSFTSNRTRRHGVDVLKGLFYGLYKQAERVRKAIQINIKKCAHPAWRGLGERVALFFLYILMRNKNTNAQQE